MGHRLPAHWPVLAQELKPAEAVPGYPAEIRKVNDKTNAIESVTRGLRQLSKNPGSLSSDEALTKLFCLALHKIKLKGTMPVRDGMAALPRLTIQFGDRIPVK